MKGKIYPYNIHPIKIDIDPATEYNEAKKTIEPEKWQKDWEENCICNTCKNDCTNSNCIIKVCSSYEEMKKVKC